MLGAVGDDQLGVRSARGAQRRATSRPTTWSSPPDAPTGVALIAVGVDGENQISVAPGANAALSPRRVDALGTLAPHVVLVSLEVPERPVRVTLEWARDHEVTTILNPAPPHPWVRDRSSLASYVTPNEHERSTLGDDPRGRHRHRDPRTRGCGDPSARRIGRTDPGASVPVVDTTGAGDCFNGVLAARTRDGTPTSRRRRDAVAGRLPVRRAPPAPARACPTTGRSARRGNGSGTRARASLGTPRRARGRRRHPGPSPGCSSRSRPR